MNKIDENKVGNDLHIQLPVDKHAFCKIPKYIDPYTIIDEYIYLPFAYSINSKYDYRPDRKNLPKSKFIFTGELRPEQEEVKEEALRYLNKVGSIMISAYPGFGKTIGAIKLASIISLEAMVITKGNVLLEQWKESIHSFSPDAKVQILNAKSDIEEGMNFYIVNAINVCKLPGKFLKRIGCLIIDEAHQVVSKILSQSLMYICPRYLIGLTATPYRSDGLDILLYLYFGKNTIFRKLKRKHIAYKVYTPYKPEIKKMGNGRIDWNSVLESQANNEQRNEDIIRLVIFLNDRNFLIMCKRVNQANYFVNRLKEEGESVTSLIGSQKKYDKSSRILVGIIAKVGVGFDNKSVNTLILAADVEEYFIQYLGRCLRTLDTVPWIFDFVDDYSILKKHSETRDQVFEDHGGVLRDFRNHFSKYPYHYP
jgi:superfamily II DNA or RNA helicase